jgi:hypothetical protein
MLEINSSDRVDWVMVGRRVQVLLVSSEGAAGVTGRWLTAIGARVDAVEEFFAALSDLIDDPMGYRLMVVDCDGQDSLGLDCVQGAIRRLGEVADRVSVILISSECRMAHFPDDRTRPIVLPAPLSAAALKKGFDHVLRLRFLHQAA